jgi:hypothetical protein
MKQFNFKLGLMAFAVSALVLSTVSLAHDRH